MTTVVDASAVVDLLARRPGHELVAQELRDQEVLAPAHFDAEVLHATRRLHLAGLISDDRRDAMVVGLVRFAAVRVPLPPLLLLARAHLGTVSAHDALYIACVEHTGADRLLTRDRRLAASPGLPIAVTVI